MPPSLLFDNHGRPIALGPQMASGGEGAVYPVDGRSSTLAKLYHEPPDAAKVRKLSGMAARAAADLCRFTAWPTATLHDGRRGPVVGFLMTRFDGFLPIHTLYSPAHRRARFPSADWAFLAAAAMNCAAAFDAVHEQGHVIGDVNQSNVLVSHQALACLIDCDSFQVREGNELFRSEVGVGPYTPPELQSVNFREVERTPNHDAFGLAVLIFHLLFMGRHPFAGRFLGAHDLSLEQAIAESRFVYSEASPDTKMSPPPFSLPLRVVGPRLSQLFERAFDEVGHRPAAAEWHAALGELRAQLRPCPRSPGHLMPPAWPVCPWCNFLQQGGPNFFLGVGIGVEYQVDAALLARLLDEIRAARPLAFPLPALVLPPAAPLAAGPRSSPGRRLISRLARLPLVGIGQVMLFGAAGWLYVSTPGFFGGCASGFFLIVLGVFLLTRLDRFQGWLRRNFTDPDQARADAVAALVEELAALAAEWEAVVERYAVEHQRLKDGLRGAGKEATGLQQAFLTHRYELEKAAARATGRAAQGRVPAPGEEPAAREHYLRALFLSDNKIPGIGGGRLALLASYGVETAFDLTDEALAAIRGIGPKLRATLLAWREERLGEFRFDPAEVLPGSCLALIPPEEARALVLHFTREEEALRSRLQKGAQDLAALTRHVEGELRQLARGRNNLAAQAVALGADPQGL